MRIDTSRPLPFVHSARKWPRTPTFARPKPVTGQLRQLTLVAVLLIVGVFVYFRPPSGPPACTQTGIGSRSYCPATPNVERWRPVGCGSSRSVGSIQGWIHVSTQLGQDTCFERCATFAYSAYSRLHESCYCSNEHASSSSDVCKSTGFALYYHPPTVVSPARSRRTRLGRLPLFAWGGEDI